MADLFAPLRPRPKLQELLLEARLRNEITAEQAAARVRCSPAFYAKLEAGYVPGVTWLPKIAKALTISLDDLKDARDVTRLQGENK